MFISNENNIMTVAEAAAYLKVSRPTLYNLIHSEGFPSFKIGTRRLISRVGLDEWIGARMQSGL